MRARSLGLILQSVYTSASANRTIRRADNGEPFINQPLRQLQETWLAGERELSVLCGCFLATNFTDLDAQYVLVGDDCTYTDDEVTKLIDALVFAAEKHRSQNRKDAAQSPYIIHPLEVLQIVFQIGGVPDLVTLLACVLHDTVEDTGVTSEDIATRYGQCVADVVMEVSDDKSLPKAERKRLQVEHAAHKSDRAKQLKYGDKCANCNDVVLAADWTTARMREYIEWAASIVRQFKGLNPRLDDHFEAIAATALKLLESR